MLGEVRKRLDKQGFCPAMLAAPSRSPGGVLTRAMAVHGIPGLGMPLALYRGEAMPIQMHTTLHRNSVPASNPDGLLRVLD